MICSLLHNEYEPESEVVVIPLIIPDRIDFNFTNSEEGVYLYMCDRVNNKKVEDMFYYYDEHSGVTNRIKLYQVIQNMLKRIKN